MTVVVVGGGSILVNKILWSGFLEYEFSCKLLSTKRLCNYVIKYVVVRVSQVGDVTTLTAMFIHNID